MIEQVGLEPVPGDLGQRGHLERAPKSPCVELACSPRSKVLAGDAPQMDQKGMDMTAVQQRSMRNVMGRMGRWLGATCLAGMAAVLALPSMALAARCAAPAEHRRDPRR
jgi:hypothetical protein